MTLSLHRPGMGTEQQAASDANREFGINAPEDQGTDEIEQILPRRSRPIRLSQSIPIAGEGTGQGITFHARSWDKEAPG